VTSAQPPGPPLHRLHDEELERLLASGERRRELVAMLGEAGYRELSTLARRAGETRRRGAVAYVLPGLMGSRIGSRGRWIDDVIWLDLLELAAGHLVRLALPRGARLRALGAMLLNALKLKLSLRVAGFDARLHAYDWRLGVEELARELNARIAAEGHRDVLLVGHSLGGVVARVALGHDRGRIARVVQLGAPNLGSFAPVLAMRGVYPTVRKLAALDPYHSAEDYARIIFRSLPSLHELLPEASYAGRDFHDPAAWPDDALRPDRTLLESAAAARAAWPAPDPRCLHVVGVRQETITRAELDGLEFEYTVTHDGDGTVPLPLAAMPGAANWYVAEKHGGLPNNGRVISAVIDLLRQGTTDRLPATTRRAKAPTSRRLTEGAMRRVAPHKVDWRQLSPDARRRLLEPVVSPEFHGEVSASALDARGAGTAPGESRTLELRIEHGSIVDANARAIVLGVYRNVDPSGAALAVDARLDGTIREFAQRRMFPGQLGQVSVLPAAKGAMLAEFVVFAGLGEFDDFGRDAQSFVADDVVRTLARTGVEDFATVLFGTGSGIPVATAVEQQLGAVLAGLEASDPGRVIRRITICEIDRRRYGSLRRAVQRLVDRPPPGAPMLSIDETDTAVSREARRAAKEVRIARVDPAYLLVTLLEHGRGDFECRSSLLTVGAKAAVLSGTAIVSRKDLRAHVGKAESGELDARGMVRFGAGLAHLVLPDSVREGLASVRHRALVVVHDREGSRVPWEALHVGDGWPALEGGLSRRYASETLTVARWSERAESSRGLRVLVAIDPTRDLPGAADEGHAVARLLRDRDAEVVMLEGAAATRDALLGAFASGGYEVLHFAGHGFFDPDDPGRSGLVCAGREVLRGADLASLGQLPALVFFNACEAARVRRRRGSERRVPVGGRPTSVAEAFLAGGVANFLGTHWPVGDQAAYAFSTRFYERLLEGETLGACVLEARRRVQEQGSIDWADYVHYGSPDFALEPARRD